MDIPLDMKDCDQLRYLITFLRDLCGYFCCSQYVCHSHDEIWIVDSVTWKSACIIHKSMQHLHAFVESASVWWWDRINIFCMMNVNTSYLVQTKVHHFIQVWKSVTDTKWQLDIMINQCPWPDLPSGHKGGIYHNRFWGTIECEPT